MDDDGSELLYDGDCVVQRPCDGLGHKTALYNWSKIDTVYVYLSIYLSI